MLESNDNALPLTRESIPELLRVVSNEAELGGATLNALQSLELLLDAGAVKEALSLARGVVAMLEGDRRDRLFQGYAALCEILVEGTLQRNLERLEQISIEISVGNFSTVDKCWTAILLSRGIQYGVTARALPHSELFRGRAILATEFSKALASGESRLAAQLGLELARSYLAGDPPELTAAQQVAETVLEAGGVDRVTRETLLDARRVQYQGSPSGTVTPSSLRMAARSLGGIARGLVELTIARASSRGSAVEERALNKALPLFETHGYRSGAFEVLVALANRANEAGHNAKALRLFSQASEIATEGGFLHGRGVALLGIFQNTFAMGDTARATSLATELMALCESELFFTAFGLNVVGCLQLIGRHQEAIKLSSRCEKFFVSRGVHSLAAQSAFMLGATNAELGKWRAARDSWRRALLCDELSRSFISACDKRNSLAQALAMLDLSEHGHIRGSTERELLKLLERSERALAPYGNAMEGRHALGRTLHIYAQIAILSRRPIESLKLVSRAREVFSSLGLSRECALTDALNGLALIEASKTGGGTLLEEGIGALQRAREFFAEVEDRRVLWKVNYYLSAAAIMRAQGVSDVAQRQAWLQMAAGFVGEALEDSAKLEKEIGMPRLSSGEGDFSPGLTPDVLESIARTLGITEREPTSPRKERSRVRHHRYGKYLH